MIQLLNRFFRLVWSLTNCETAMTRTWNRYELSVPSPPIRMQSNNGVQTQTHEPQVSQATSVLYIQYDHAAVTYGARRWRSDDPVVIELKTTSTDSYFKFTRYISTRDNGGRISYIQS